MKVLAKPQRVRILAILCGRVARKTSGRAFSKQAESFGKRAMGPV
jgi:hypothetical protein